MRRRPSLSTDLKGGGNVANITMQIFDLHGVHVLFSITTLFVEIECVNMQIYALTKILKRFPAEIKNSVKQEKIVPVITVLLFLLSNL